MQTNKGRRPYVTNDAQRRVELFANSTGISNKEAYHEIITGAIDETGKPRKVLSLTDPQMKAINDIAKEMGQSVEQTVRDLINFSMLLYATPVSLREIFVFSSPLLMDRLVQYNPGIAKQILQGLKQIEQS